MGTKHDELQQFMDQQILPAKFRMSGEAANDKLPGRSRNGAQPRSGSIQTNGPRPRSIRLALDLMLELKSFPCWRRRKLVCVHACMPVCAPARARAHVRARARLCARMCLCVFVFVFVFVFVCVCVCVCVLSLIHI